jgi:hypothetical protein
MSYMRTVYNTWQSPDRSFDVRVDGDPMLSEIHFGDAHADLYVVASRQQLADLRDKLTAHLDQYVPASPAIPEAEPASEPETVQACGAICLADEPGYDCGARCHYAVGHKGPHSYEPF